ncbi:MAG TPA: riboflavin synthase [Casimicrobiaceae bacterium]|jgi:riboflavin synthase
MFTGIVEALGSIEDIREAGDGVRVTIAAADLDLSDVAVGDSIAVNGCCLTVVVADRQSLTFDMSGETLRCTAPLERGRRVHLEKSLRLADRLGGHLVAGHVDGVGTVAQSRAVADDAGGSRYVAIDAPAELARFIAPKGSIAVHGVSLTVNTIEGTRFAANLIPHTLDVTTFKDLLPGTKVNLEVDMVARYVARLVEFSR